ncbi:hypothetical protein [Magnetospirillum sp. 15-1]|uniref:hypothetical protein n=1 Tax=Magnetospirillum sp. 15-1 TaxID=1979370 RepID=UPI000BBCB685|nr:hypothetical protein [Magnetospirillum sp. 15-1]
MMATRRDVLIGAAVVGCSLVSRPALATTGRHESGRPHLLLGVDDPVATAFVDGVSAGLQIHGIGLASSSTLLRHDLFDFTRLRARLSGLAGTSLICLVDNAGALMIDAVSRDLGTTTLSRINHSAEGRRHRALSAGEGEGIGGRFAGALDACGGQGHIHELPLSGGGEWSCRMGRTDLGGETNWPMALGSVLAHLAAGISPRHAPPERPGRPMENSPAQKGASYVSFVLKIEKGTLG